MPAERDFVNRDRIVSAFGTVSHPGDFDTADWLEAQLQTEENIRFVRPQMVWIIRYLRTGEY